MPSCKQLIQYLIGLSISPIFPFTHQIQLCDRWRHEFRTDALFLEIKFVLERFFPTFLQLFQVRLTGCRLYWPFIIDPTGH